MIPYSRFSIIGNEEKYIAEALSSMHLSGDGKFTKKCNRFLEKELNCKKALITQSCTAALEMAAILLDIKPGDEVIMPSYTFVSTANAFVLRGAIPVFVDIRPDTLNIDESLVEDAITEKTRAIVPVHYAGNACEMNKLIRIANKYSLEIIEDAAQGVFSKYKDKYLGTIGSLGTLSFHDTKNIVSGEGGAILINDEKYIERVEIIREKGTNRTKFFQGVVDKYTWVDIGSSYLPSELTSAFLYAQLEKGIEITEKRLHIGWKYSILLDKLKKEGEIYYPSLYEGNGELKGNAHIFYILTKNKIIRDSLMQYLREKEVYSVFHYIPLHTSDAGKKYGRSSGELNITESVSDRVLRLPLFYDMTDNQIEYVCSLIFEFFRTNPK